MGKIKAKGMFDDLINTILPELIYGAFDTGGQGCVDAIKEGVSKDEGRLAGSLSYAHRKRVARVSGEAKEGDGAPQPDVIFTMYIGTRVPYAWYVEKGSGPHNTGNDSAGFVERITAWGAKHGWGEDEIPKLIAAIRKNGTEAHPFFFDKQAVVNAIMIREMEKAMSVLGSKINRSGPLVTDLVFGSNNR